MGLEQFAPPLRAQRALQRQPRQDRARLLLSEALQNSIEHPGPILPTEDFSHDVLEGRPVLARTLAHALATRSLALLPS